MTKYLDGPCVEVSGHVIPIGWIYLTARSFKPLSLIIFTAALKIIKVVKCRVKNARNAPLTKYFSVHLFTPNKNIMTPIAAMRLVMRSTLKTLLMTTAVVAFASCGKPTANSPIVEVLAGSDRELGSVDGFETNARFRIISSIAKDNFGNLYVAEGVGSAIRKISKNGDVETVAGLSGNSGIIDGGKNLTRLGFPTGLVAGPDKKLYFIDMHFNGNKKNPMFANTIKSIDLVDGNVTTIAGEPFKKGSKDGIGESARFSAPGDLAIDNSGNIYVADTGNCTIRKIYNSGEVNTIAGSPGACDLLDGSESVARLDEPYALALNKSNEIYFLDNGGLRVLLPTGEAKTIASIRDLSGDPDSFIRDINDIAINSKGDIYVSLMSGVIKKLSRKSGLIIDFNINTLNFRTNPDLIYMPFSIEVDESDNLIVAVGSSNRSTNSGGALLLRIKNW